MRFMTAGKKAIAVLLAILMITTPLAAMQQSSEFTRGKAEGEQAARGNGLWVLGGLVCGVFAVAAAYLTKPKPPAQVLVGKSPDYVLGYTDGYGRKARNKNGGYALIGWVAWVAIFVAVSASSSD